MSCLCDNNNGYLCFDCECDIMQIKYNFTLSDDGTTWIPDEAYTDDEIRAIVNEYGIVNVCYSYETLHGGRS